MNCSRFRFLIQQYFDEELAPQDERMLIAHLDSCDSCERFRHQIEQVLQAAPDVPLPDECLPGNVEALARRIMQELPREKPGFFSMLRSMFPFGKGKAPKEESRKEKGPAFPHVKRGAAQEESRRPSTPLKYDTEDDLRATSSRLKNLARLSHEDQADQTTTQGLSLGTKLGVTVPQQQQQETPLTLAESIRKMVSDEKVGDQATSGSQPAMGQPPPFGVPAQQDAMPPFQAEAGFPPAGRQQPGQPPFGQPNQPGRGWEDQSSSPPSWANPGASPPFAPAGAPQQGEPSPMVGPWADKRPAWEAPGGESPGQHPPQQSGGGWPQDAGPSQQRQPDWAYPSASGNWHDTQAGAAQDKGWNALGSAPGQSQDNDWHTEAGSWQQQPEPASPLRTAGDGWNTNTGDWGSPAGASPPAQGAGGSDWSSQSSSGTQQNWQIPAPGWPPGGQSQDSPHNGWSTQPPAAAKPQPPSQDGWRTGASEAGSWNTASPDPSPGAPQAPSWTEESEQIHTGMWQAFSLEDSGLGQPKSQAPSQKPGGGFPLPPRAQAAAGALQPELPPQPQPRPESVWDQPVQHRVGNQPPGPDPFGQRPSATEERWDQPIQQRATQSTSSESWPACGQPAPAGGSQFKSSGADNVPQGASGGLMDRLTNILGDMASGNDAAGTAPQQQSPLWGSGDGARGLPGNWNVDPPNGTSQSAETQRTSGQWAEHPARQKPPTFASGTDWSAVTDLNAPLPTPQTTSPEQWGQQPGQPAGGWSATPPAPQASAGWTTQPAQQAPDPWSSAPPAAQPQGGWTTAEPAQQHPAGWATPGPQPQSGAWADPDPPQQAGEWTTPAARQVPPDEWSTAAPAPEWQAQNASQQTPGSRAASNSQPQPASDWAAPSQSPPPGDGWAAPAQSQPPAGGWAAPSQSQPSSSSLIGRLADSPAGGWAAPAQSQPPADEVAAPGAPQQQPGGWGSSAPQSQPEAWSSPAPSTEPAPPPAATAARAGENSSGLLRVDDSTIDRVFRENLGINESGKGVQSPEPDAAAPAPPPPTATGAPSQVVRPAASGMPASVPRIAPPTVPVPGQGTGTSAIPPAAPPQQPAAAAPAPPRVSAVSQPSIPENSSGLLKIDDQTIDHIFKENLGIHDQQQPGAARQAPQPVPGASAPSGGGPAPLPEPPLPQQQSAWNSPPGQLPPAAPPPAPPAAAPTVAPAVPPVAAAQRQGGGLLNVDDATIDKLFTNLGVNEAAAPKLSMREAVASIRSVANVPPPPKISGISRLAREDQSVEATSGKIAQIGKFLLDSKDLDKIGNLTKEDLSDTKIRVLTLEAADEIGKLLQHIGTQPGVVGSVIVGHDGILIANNLPQDMDPESVGIWSLGIYVNTTNATKKLGHSHLHQLVARSPIGYLVIADFGGGILVTVSNGQETDKLIPLMRNITQLVAQ